MSIRKDNTVKNIINTHHKDLEFTDIKVYIESGEIKKVSDAVAKYMIASPHIQIVVNKIQNVSDKKTGGNLTKRKKRKD